MKGNKISQAGEPSGALPPAEASPLRNILLVDDDPNIRRLNAMVLHHAGYHVDTAEDGAMAWEMLGDSHFDLMITDNNMPHLTGMELLKKLYASRMTLPFIMATGKCRRRNLPDAPGSCPPPHCSSPIRSWNCWER